MKSLANHEVHLFFRLLFQLHIYAAKKYKLLNNVTTWVAYAQDPSQKQKCLVRNAIFEDMSSNSNSKIIDLYIEKNPDKLTASELDVIIKWRDYMVYSYFYVYKYTSEGAIFIRDHNTKTEVFLAKGLSQPIEEVLGSTKQPLPIRYKAALLPFQGKIVYDGLVYGDIVSVSMMPPEQAKTLTTKLDAMYAEALSKNQIIKVLDVNRMIEMRPQYKLPEEVFNQESPVKTTTTTDSSDPIIKVLRQPPPPRIPFNQQQLIQTTMFFMQMADSLIGLLGGGEANYKRAAFTLAMSLLVDADVDYEYSVTPHEAQQAIDRCTKIIDQVSTYEQTKFLKMNVNLLRAIRSFIRNADMNQRGRKDKTKSKQLLDEAKTHLSEAIVLCEEIIAEGHEPDLFQIYKKKECTEQAREYTDMEPKKVEFVISGAGFRSWNVYPILTPQHYLSNMYLAKAKICLKVHGLNNHNHAYTYKDQEFGNYLKKALLANNRNYEAYFMLGHHYNHFDDYINSFDAYSLGAWTCPFDWHLHPESLIEAATSFMHCMSLIGSTNEKELRRIMLKDGAFTFKKDRKGEPGMHLKDTVNRLELFHTQYKQARADAAQWLEYDTRSPVETGESNLVNTMKDLKQKLAAVKAARKLDKTSKGCQNCGKKASEDLKLKTCANCNTVFYCSRNCQVADWPKHKELCKQFKNKEKVALFVVNDENKANYVVIDKQKK